MRQGVEERSNEKDWISAGDRRQTEHKTQNIKHQFYRYNQSYSIYDTFVIAHQST